MDQAQTRYARKITAALFAGQSFGTAGFIAVASVTSIAAAQLSGRPALAGLPAAVLLGGAAFSAYAWGYIMDLIGRRLALVLGAALGVAGALAGAAAIEGGSFGLFLGANLGLGASRSALQLARYAAAEVHPPSQRGRAISNVVLGGTIGAIVGPLVIAPSGLMALEWNLPELAGAFLAASGLLMSGLVLNFIFLRPDPREVSAEIDRQFPDQGPRAGTRRPTSEILREPGVIVAVVAMVVGQAVMVMIMVISSLHMSNHDHNLANISLAMSAHTTGMYAPALISGRLADRWGRTTVILIGAATLALAGLLTIPSPALFPLSLALFLLGLGWNFCFVGGSSLLADQLSALERSRTQGASDLMVGLASAAGSLGSGVVFASVGFATMGLVGAVVALIPLVLTFWWRSAGQDPPRGLPSQALAAEHAEVTEGS